MSLLPMALVAAAQGRGGTTHTGPHCSLFEKLHSSSVPPRDFRWGDVLVEQN